METEIDRTLEIVKIMLVTAHRLTGSIRKLGYRSAVDILQLNDDVEGFCKCIIRTEGTDTEAHLYPILKVLVELLSAVEVEAVGFKHGFLVDEPHIVAHTSQVGITVIVEIIAIEEQGVALLHLHIAERLHRVLFCKEVCTVAIHIHTVATERNIANEYKGIGHTLLVELGGVGVQHIHIVALFCRNGVTGLCNCTRLDLLRKHGVSKQHK